jgi:N-acetylglucosamine kinase-like BadF-type ATPase
MHRILLRRCVQGRVETERAFAGTDTGAGGGVPSTRRGGLIRQVLYSWGTLNSYFLGVDVGATKTHALLAEASGTVVGFGEAGSGNPFHVGDDGLFRAIASAVEQALQSARVSKAGIRGAGFGIAGYNWPSEHPALSRTVQALGLSAPVHIVNDAIIGLLAGTPAGWGIGLVAGTHCNCRGWDRERREGRVIGFKMGEAAGAKALVQQAVYAVARHYTCRGPETGLTAAFVGAAGARGVDDLLEGLTSGRYALTASAAPIVFAEAERGDPVAGELIRWAGRELGSLATGVVRQLGLEAAAFDLVLIGSLFRGGPRLIQAVEKAVRPVAAHARLVRLKAPPVVGGVLLAMEQTAFERDRVHEALVSGSLAFAAREPAPPSSYG